MRPVEKTWEIMKAKKHQKFTTLKTYQAVDLCLVNSVPSYSFAKLHWVQLAQSKESNLVVHVIVEAASRQVRRSRENRFDTQIN